MTIRDKWKHEQGNYVHLREYPTRNAVLEGNKALQSADGVKKLDGVRAISRMPAHEQKRLADAARAGKMPSYMADLDSRDGEMKTKAHLKLMNSSDGKAYKVGSTPQKQFGMPKYKYVGDGKYEAL